ncbi:MAG: Ig-like domain-containing protein [Pseudomonadota bacterium]
MRPAASSSRWPLLLATAVGTCVLPAAAAADCITTPELCNLTVQSTIEQPDLDMAIDVVLVGDGFRFGGGVDQDGWHAVAASAINTFKTQTATGLYGGVPAIYNFHVIDVASASTEVGDADTADTALGMNVGGSFITALDGRVSQAALNAPDVDVVIAIANSSSGRANASFPAQLASGGRVRMSRSLAPTSHELGHAIFRLEDEYIESGLCHAKTEAALVRSRNATADPSCTKFQSTPGAGCVQGAVYCATGLYRSASGCLMSSNGNVATCPVCQRTVHDILHERRTGVDYAEPWAVISAPADGAVLAGVTAFSAVLYDDDFAPTDLAFEIDGVFRGAVTTSSTSASLSFDTRMLADGAHSLQVIAGDAAGHARPSLAVAFGTTNHSDTTPPVVMLGAPTDGSQVAGKVSISAQVSGSPGDIERMVVRVDGDPVVAVFGRSSLSGIWDSTTVSLGTHVVTAEAVDVAQNLGSSAPATVTVEAEVPRVQDPSIYIQAPPGWSAVGPMFELSYMIFGAASGASADLLLDGVAIQPSPLPPPLSGGGVGGSGNGEGAQSVLLDASTWSAGPHQLQIRVHSGGQDYDSTVLVVVRVVSDLPGIFLISPADAFACLRGSVTVQADGFDDVGITGVTLLVDGTARGSAASVPAQISLDTTQLADGTHTLQLQAHDGAAHSCLSELLNVRFDNTPPLLAMDVPQAGATVAEGVVQVALSTSDAGCGLSSLELLVDGAVQRECSPWSLASCFVDLSAGTHSVAARATDSAGNSTSSVPHSVLIASCSSGTCDDGNSCTTDSCAPTGVCRHVPTTGCCQNGDPCEDGDPCTSDACVTGQCEHTAIASCCTSALDCTDADDCNLDLCLTPGASCSHPAAGCCNGDGECDDANGCTSDACIGAPDGRCGHAWTPDCCRSAPDCDDGDLCTQDSCNSGTCSHLSQLGCCNTGADCSDGDSCTSDLCTNNVCRWLPIANCCEFATDCSSLNPCVTLACTSGRCVETATPDCCSFASECADSDPCTLDLCGNGHLCTHSPIANCPPVDGGPAADATSTDSAPGSDAGAADTGAFDATPSDGAGADGTTTIDAATSDASGTDHVAGDGNGQDAAATDSASLDLTATDGTSNGDATAATDAMQQDSGGADLGSADHGTADHFAMDTASADVRADATATVDTSAAQDAATSGEDGPVGVDRSPPSVARVGAGCSCGQAHGPPTAVLALLGLLARVRRRRCPAR